jgi:hypothetical protein
MPSSHRLLSLSLSLSFSIRLRLKLNKAQAQLQLLASARWPLSSQARLSLTG